MFKPRHAYRSPITNRYRGKAKGCPVFNNLGDISSSMVEQHDKCLECLAKIKNRTDIYKTLAENNKPSNNVIRSLQRLSSSASNNRLKTCLQFLIIKVNEKSIQPPQKATNTNGTTTITMSTTATTNATTTTTISTSATTNNNNNDLSNGLSAPNSNGCRISPRSLEAKESINRQSANLGKVSHCIETNGKSLRKRQKSQHRKQQHLSLSPSPSPELINELKGPRLKLSEEKIRKIKKRPITFDDYYMESSFACSSSTPTTSSGSSPGPSSITTTPNSDIASYRVPMHMFQAPPRLFIHLKPYVAPPTKPNELTPPQSSPPVKKAKVETVNCAICGVKEDILKVKKLYGQYGCKICATFFEKFLENPVELYCCQDGDCIMAFDSRCRACWVKICLQKFDIGEDLREKIGVKFQPRLLSFPNVSLITIDTSLI